MATTPSYVTPDPVTSTSVNEAAAAFKEISRKTRARVRNERSLTTDENRLAEIAATLVSLENIRTEWNAANHNTSTAAANELFIAIGEKFDGIVATYEQERLAFVRKMNEVAEKASAPQPAPAETRQMEQPPTNQPTSDGTARNRARAVLDSIVGGRGANKHAK